MHKKNRIVRAFLQTNIDSGEGTGEGTGKGTGKGTNSNVEKKEEFKERLELGYLKDELDKIKIKPKYIKIKIIK